MNGKECSAAVLAQRAISVLMAAVDATCGRGRYAPEQTEKAETESPPTTPPDEKDDLKVKEATPLRQTARVGNTSRDRMKMEMQHLRDTKEELQRQLDELKRRSPRIDAIKSKDPSTMQLATAWEAMARGQCEQRYRAEVENVKLRALLDEQMKIAQTLERILAKRKNVEYVDGKVRKRTRVSNPSARSPLDNPDAMADMNAVLPSLYLQVDNVVNKSCFQSRTVPFRDVSTHHAEPSGVYVEATELRLLPFSLRDTAEAVWHSFITYPDCKSSLADNDERVECQLERDMDLSLQLQRFSGDVGVKFVARRFEERNRVVFVWVAMIDPSEIPIDDVIIRHTGWVCLRPSRVVPHAEGITEYLHAQLCVPEFHHGDWDRKRRVGTLTNFIVDSLESQLDQSKQSIDNRLLELALAKAKQELRV